MQRLLPLDDRTQLLAEIDRRLERRFGRPGPFHRLDPVSQLVMGIIGGRTRGAVSMAAFEALRRRFGSWEAVRDAASEDIRRAIRAVTYAERKAPYLKTALGHITARCGSLSLDLLDGLSADAARRWLERLPGVGPKAAAATLNFSTLGKAVLVVDTHHLRVLRRLALIDPRSSLGRAFDRVMPMLPAGWDAGDMDRHHELMKRLGQTICRHAAPDCRRCPLRDLCPAAGGSGRDGSEAAPARLSAPAAGR